MIKGGTTVPTSSCGSLLGWGRCFQTLRRSLLSPWHLNNTDIIKYNLLYPEISCFWIIVSIMFKVLLFYICMRNNLHMDPLDFCYALWWTYSMVCTLNLVCHSCTAFSRYPLADIHWWLYIFKDLISLSPSLIYNQ